MAATQTFVDKLEKELTCSICEDIFTDPKTLPCLHSFCTQCIYQWYKTCKASKQRCTCPSCRSPIELPDEDASKLPSSFYLNALLPLLHSMRRESNKELPPSECRSCEKSLVLVAFCPQCNGMICAECIDVHKTVKQLRDEHHITMLSDFKQENVDTFIKNQMFCQEKFHEKNKLEYYCREETCRRCICQKCAILGHNNHNKVSVEEEADHVKQTIRKDMNRLKSLKKLVNNYDKEAAEKNMIRIQRQLVSAKQKVHDDAETAVKIIRDQEATTIKILEGKELKLQTEYQQVQSNISKGILDESEIQLYCKTLLMKKVAYEILEVKKVLRQRCQTVFENLSVLANNQVERDVTVHYVTNQQVMKSLQNLGKIEESVADPTCCTIESLKEIRRGFLNEFEIATRNSRNGICYTEIESFDVQIKDWHGNDVEKYTVQDPQSGIVRVSYRAEKAAPYEILVNIGGEPIRNSPQNVHTLEVQTEFKPVKTFGEKGHGQGQFCKPTSIALSDNGEIAIADNGNHRIQILNLDGQHLREFGFKGHEDGQLTNPYGLVFIGNRILVSDEPGGYGRIQEFDNYGNFKRLFYSSEEAFHPRGMCATEDGKIAVCCWGNMKINVKPCIKLLSKQGDLVFEYFDIEEDEQPFHIAYSKGRYFVSYFFNKWIGVFEENGNLLFQFEGGRSDNEFSDNLWGIAVYGPDMILVCDSSKHRVQLLTQNGQFIRSFGSFGSGVGEMSYPIDLVVTADGQVFVLDNASSHLQVWR